jgi:MFS family permease
VALTPEERAEPEQTAREPVSRAHAQAVATSFLALFSISGLGFYGLSFFFDFMVREFGWTLLQVTSGNAFGKIVVGPLFGFGAGWIIDRFGPRRLMMAGVVAMGVALFGLGSIGTLPGFYFFYALNALGFVCAGPLPNQVLLSRWFDRNRGRAMSVAYLGIGVGWAVAPQMARVLEQAYGWHWALKGMGLVAILIALPLIIVLPPWDPGHLGQADRKTTIASPGTEVPALPMKALFGSRAFFLLAVASMCSIGAVGATNQHLKIFLILDRGYTQAQAASVLSMVGMASLGGRLLVGWCADRFPKKYVMLIVYLLVAAALPLLYGSSSFALALVFAVVFGVAVGGDYLMIPLMAAELFGVRVLGRLLGIVLTADGIAEALAPMLVGHLRDATKSYASGFGVLIVMALVGALAVAMLPRNPLSPTRPRE